jgi:sec-independent protein translocase protein TatC
MLLIFGIAIEIPFFVILLNLAGVVSGKTLGRYRPWIIIGVFVFAAVATPSTDPFSMLMLAIPLQCSSSSPRSSPLVDRRPRRGATAPTSGTTTSALADLMSDRRGRARLDPFDLPEWLGATGGLDP